MRQTTLIVSIVLLVSLSGCFSCRADREREKAHDECIAWANNHVYPDGKRVVDSVDPEAWCGAENNR